MTPMQTLKNNLLSFREKLENFEEINLNKAHPKDTWRQNADDHYTLAFPDDEANFTHFHKKGVKSDFIKIFKGKSKKGKCSIAFHFTYLEGVEPEIQCSVKEKESFVISEPMNVEEFKEKLNYFNQTSSSPDVLEIIDKVKDGFFSTPKKHKMKNH